jgi:CheY-like chemotaxis protein
VVNTLRDSNPEYQHVAAKIQQHKEQIERFLESIPDGRKHFEKVRQLPDVWRKGILIVEDDPAVAELLSAVLAGEGVVETAENGEKGLKKTSEQYFDVIVSDVDMPIMSGIEFYEKATRKDTGIGKRFLFFTGQPTPENLAFFAKYHLRYMIKPSGIDDIRTAVHDIMQKTSKEVMD